MRIGLAQCAPTSGNIQANLTIARRFLTQAKQASADLVVFPELSMCGYCLNDHFEDVYFLTEQKKAVHTLAKECLGIGALVGFVDFDPDTRDAGGRVRRWNAAALIAEGKVQSVTRKSLLPSYRYFDEGRHFTPAPSIAPMMLQYGTRSLSLGVMICEDAWDSRYDRHPAAELAKAGAEVLISLNASPFVLGKASYRERLCVGHAQRAGLPFVYVNTVGIGDNGKNIIPFDGASFAVSKAGAVCARLSPFVEELSVIDLESSPAASPPVVKDQNEDVIDALTMSIREYSRRTGFSTIIEPVSGGIDSAVSTALAALAVGAENVKAVSLPSQFSSGTTKQAVEDLCNAFSIPLTWIPINQLMKEFTGAYESGYGPIASGITRENLQSRIRGILCMMASNDMRGLLMSNGNKTEIALGYSTLYGDMCGGLSPIGDCSKRRVYEIAALINKRAGRAVIPEASITVTPSAELADGQVDPFNYEIVSPIVDCMIEERWGPEELIQRFTDRSLPLQRFEYGTHSKPFYERITAEEFSKAVRDSHRRMRINVYKRLQGPPGISITERALGFDLRESILSVDAPVV